MNGMKRSQYSKERQGELRWLKQEMQKNVGQSGKGKEGGLCKESTMITNCIVKKLKFA
jgi:hypothetical protein